MAPRLRHIVAFEELAAALQRAAGPHAGRTVPVSHLELRQSSVLDADALHLLLHALPSLGSLNLAQSAGVGDDVLRMLAVHKVTVQEPELPHALQAMHLAVWICCACLLCETGSLAGMSCGQWCDRAALCFWHHVLHCS